MSIAVSSLVLFLFLLPGLFFFRFYYSGYFSKQYVKTTLFEAFSMAIVPAFVFQCLGIYLVNSLQPFELTIDLNLVRELVSISGESTNAYSNLQNYAGYILLYNASLWVIAAVTGRLTLFLVRKSKADIFFKIFRFQNHWHYLFSDEHDSIPSVLKRELNFEGKSGKGMKLAATYLDIICQIGDKIYLYKGVLRDYLLSKEGGLELIYLQECHRKEINHKAKIENEDKSSEYYQIPGKYFVIRYTDVINLNIRYSYSPKEKKNYNETLYSFIGLFFIALVILGIILAYAISFYLGLVVTALLVLIYLFRLNTGKPEASDLADKLLGFISIILMIAGLVKIFMLSVPIGISIIAIFLGSFYYAITYQRKKEKKRREEKKEE